ncbi:pesticin receptor precursor [Halomonas elongata]|uniref:Pesticin receptor n=1 Tax=Halomonas elongata TaxID=2746 RepID=A0A1B8P1I0_HALEL|nr:TonB-dependent receptor [Halomonas elongata]OBX36114.1 pesticin receptor precursor [Halomonas elongata]
MSLMHRTPHRLKTSHGTILTNTFFIPCVALFAGHAIAQDGEDSSNATKLDTIVVTGEKMERSLHRTASSVSVITADDVESEPQAQTVPDILDGVPNILYTSKTDAPIIRGVDTKGPVRAGNAYLSKPVPRATISVDGRYLSSAEYGIGAATLWDVDSIEVFRGPQTTSQGANSIAGAIVINTKDPTFTPEWGGQLLYGSENKQRASFVASGPLSDDFAARLALDYSGRDTFVSYTNPEFTAHDKDLDFENFNARFKALWQPLDIPGIEAKFTFSHTEVDRPSSEPVSKPYKDHNSETLYVDTQETVSDTAILDLDYDFGNDVRISNQLQYSSGEFNFYFSPPFSGTASRDFDNISNELRLNFGSTESEFSGFSGVYYSHENSKNKLDNSLGWTDADITQDSLGIFSEVSWRFIDDWTLTGGLRYQRDRIQHEGIASYVPDVDYAYDETFDAVLPKVSLAYDISDDVTVGALISKGYVPGGTGVDFSGGKYYTFNEETAWNYELFTRANFLDDRLFLSSNLFYTVYEDSQRSVTDYTDDGRRSSIIVNGDEAKAYGLEMNTDYQATDALRLHAGLGLLKTNVSEFNDSRGSEFVDNEFSQSPGYMFNIGAAWDINSQFRLSGDIRHTDGYFSTDDNDPSLHVDSYTLANAKLTHYLTDNIELFAYVDNIWDEDAPTQKFTDRSAGVSAYIVSPREFGVGLKASF